MERELNIVSEESRDLATCLADKEHQESDL